MKVLSKGCYNCGSHSWEDVDPDDHLDLALDLGAAELSFSLCCLDCGCSNDLTYSLASVRLGWGNQLVPDGVGLDDPAYPHGTMIRLDVDNPHHPALQTHKELLKKSN